MSIENQLDPESAIPLQALLEAFPGGFNSVADIVERRAMLEQLQTAARAQLPHNPNVTMSTHQVEQSEATEPLEIRIYRPTQSAGVLPCLANIHGGGMIMGSLDIEDPNCRALCETLNICIASIDYRKAPEHPYPAAPRDCYAGIKWLAEHAEEMQIDPTNLGLIGFSAGGCLAIAVALMIRDLGGPQLKYLVPVYPMLDDRNETPSSKAITNVGVWDRSTNIEAWDWYLGSQEADGYAAPARMQDLSGLPPTFISVGSMDLFYDECVAFAKRLKDAGVATEFKTYAGAYHASERMAPDAALSVQIMQDRIAALKDFIGGP